MRYPGTIVIEFLDPLPAGMGRKEFREQLESRLEAACNRLIAEAKAAISNKSEHK
jgi:1-acyl-sn-glycerol-3-phosphate acyltransferase